MKVGDSKLLTVRLEAQTRTAVVFSSIVIEGGGAAAYRLGTTPTQIDSLGTATMTVTFTPPAVAAFTASLVLNSNDPDRPATRIALAGEGALPKISRHARLPGAARLHRSRWWSIHPRSTSAWSRWCACCRSIPPGCRRW